MKPALALAFLAASALPAAPARDGADLALRGLDPIELIDGREVDGDESLAATHAGYAYRFVSEENRELFLSEPERWGIQWDGACGRMGPLSGRGHPDRFAVWDGRIWVFASDSCREGFLKAPEKLQPPDEEPPAADEAALARGRELLERAVAALGGAQAFDAVPCVHLKSELATRSGTTDYHGTREAWFGAPGCYRFEESWGGPAYGHAIGRGGAKRIDESGEARLGAVSAVAVEREALHHPIGLLRARHGLIAAAAGSDTVEGKAVDLVALHGARHVVTLALDAASGRPVELRFLALTSRGYAPVVRRITAWKRAGALELPVRVQGVGANGLADDSVAGEVSVSLDAPVAPEFFAPPAQ